MKQLEVQIMGQSYLLGCPDGGDSRMLEAVERVDTAMCKIRDGGKVRARERIAVLAALNLAFDLADQRTAPLEEPVDDLKRSVKSDAATDASAVDSNQLLVSLLERLDGALGSDGRLL
jgi:cell division protein ZapA